MILEFIIVVSRYEISLTCLSYKTVTKTLCSPEKGWRHTLKIQKYLVLVELCSNKTSKTATTMKFQLFNRIKTVISYSGIAWLRVNEWISWIIIISIFLNLWIIISGPATLIAHQMSYAFLTHIWYDSYNYSITVIIPLIWLVSMSSRGGVAGITSCDTSSSTDVTL